MKKVILSLAVVAAMFVSCKEATENAETMIDSTATAIEETAETVTDSAAVAIDSTAAKIKETAKVSLQKVDEAIK